MANNYRGSGDRIPVVAPGAVTAGDIVVVNTQLFGVAGNTVASAAEVVIQRGGVWDLSKVTGTNGSALVGAIAYWDNTGKKVTIFAARGGLYAGTPKDSQTTYVRDFLAFIGGGGRGNVALAERKLRSPARGGQHHLAGPRLAMPPAVAARGVWIDIVMGVLDHGQIHAVCA